MNLIELIQQIARSDEIMAKIRANIIPADPNPLPSYVGIGRGPNTVVCDSSYDLPASSSFAFIDIIDNGLGPTPGDACSHINTITGLVDFDTSQAAATFGAEVDLIIQMDGVFK